MNEQKNTVETFVAQESRELIPLQKYLIDLLRYYQTKENSDHTLGAIEAITSISLEVDRLMQGEEKEGEANA
ncbi:hypothetical protein H6231_002452 [Enterococcus hirae]|nr:hypothetical protein [Enterococcus hirae]